jgi:penicillin-binding protein 1C
VPRKPSPSRVLLAALLGPALAGLVLLAVGFVHWWRLPALDVPAHVAERSRLVLDREGRLLRPFLTAGGRWRLPVTAAEVDPRYLALLKAVEDRRFDHHHGVDPLALLRAGLQLLWHGRVVSGGSTLSMQVARLIEPREERTAGAKLTQVVRAIELERRYSKAELLGFYLSLAPFGGNIEGVRAASLAWFGREPQRLSLAEAALLVALPQAPELRRPDRSPGRAEAARRRVLARAELAGLITPGERQAAEREPLPLARRAFPALAPHVAEQALAAEPHSASIRLSLDARLQAQLEALARERAAEVGPRVSIAMLVVEHATGLIRASVGGADYFADERAGGLDLTRALRSPGSALKPFIYGLAFEQGIAHPETLLFDRPVRYGLYAPENFDMRHHGPVSARRALQLSLNVPAVDLLAALGPQRLLARLRQTGATLALPREGAPGLAIGLGGVGITLHDLTMLYAGLARGGQAVPLALRPGNTGEGSTLMDPVAAWYVADSLLGAPPPQHAPEQRLAHKTGTSYGYRDAWAIGFDRRHTIGIWVGRPDNGAVPGLVGRMVASPILFDAFQRVGLEAGPPPRPADAIVAAGPQALPPPLRQLAGAQPRPQGQPAGAGLKLAFPPDGAALDLAASQVDGVPLLVLKAMGGAPPFTFLVDGLPIGSGPRRQMSWQPAGAGFISVGVVDGSGNTDSVRVRLQ